MGYDQWLEEPYQEECRAQEEWERAEEDFLDSDYYIEAYNEWLEEHGNAGKSEADYQQSSDYGRSVDFHLAMMKGSSPYD